MVAKSISSGRMPARSKAIGPDTAAGPVVKSGHSLMVTCEMVWP
jgi:hypothetical protein